MRVEADGEGQRRRQVRILAGLLGQDRAVASAHLTRLATWATHDAPDGVLTGRSPRTIARAAGWRGDPAVLLNALVQARCIHRRPGQTRLSSWPAAPGPPAEMPRFSARLSAHDLWQAALRELAGLVNHANFEAFLHDTVGLYQSGNWVAIGVPSTYASEVLARRFRTAIDRALFEVTGQPLHARLVCLPPPSPDSA